MFHNPFCSEDPFSFITDLEDPLNKKIMFMVPHCATQFMSSRCLIFDKGSDWVKVQRVEWAAGKLTIGVKVEGVGYFCCVFRPAFGCCEHPKAGRTITSVGRGGLVLPGLVTRGSQ